MLVASIRETKRPISGDSLGHRIVIVVDNQEQYNWFTQSYTTSFAPRFRVWESSDYTSPDRALDKLDNIVHLLSTKSRIRVELRAIYQ